MKTCVSSWIHISQIDVEEHRLHQRTKERSKGDSRAPGPAANPGAHFHNSAKNPPGAFIISLLWFLKEEPRVKFSSRNVQLIGVEGTDVDESTSYTVRRSATTHTTAAVTRGAVKITPVTT